MNTADELVKRASQLSEEHQAEVLDFIAFLASKEAEDREDLKLFDERKNEPARPLKEIVAEMKADGQL